MTDSAGHVVHKFSPEGELLMTLCEKGMAGENTSRDRFNQPNHVAVTAEGDIDVSRRIRQLGIVHFSPEGEYIRTIGGEQGSDPGQIQLPHGARKHPSLLVPKR